MKFIYLYPFLFKGEEEWFKYYGHLTTEEISQLHKWIEAYQKDFHHYEV